MDSKKEKDGAANVKNATVALSELALNKGQIQDVPKNPRFIKDERYAALKKSIEDDPEMLDLRELVAYDNGGELVIIMGNMRYRAMKELGLKEAPVKILPKDTPAKKLRAYIQKDNIAFGQNDWDLLGNEWDTEELQDFGLECDFLNPSNFDDADVFDDLEEGAFINKIGEESEVFSITFNFPKEHEEEIINYVNETGKPAIVDMIVNIALGEANEVEVETPK